MKEQNHTSFRGIKLSEEISTWHPYMILKTFKNDSKFQFIDRESSLDSLKQCKETTSLNDKPHKKTH